MRGKAGWRLTCSPGSYDGCRGEDDLPCSFKASFNVGPLAGVTYHPFRHAA